MSVVRIVRFFCDYFECDELEEPFLNFTEAKQEMHRLGWRQVPEGDLCPQHIVSYNEQTGKGSE